MIHATFQETMLANMGGRSRNRPNFNEMDTLLRKQDQAYSAPLPPDPMNASPGQELADTDGAPAQDALYQNARDWFSTLCAEFLMFLHEAIDDRIRESSDPIPAGSAGRIPKSRLRLNQTLEHRRAFCAPPPAAVSDDLTADTSLDAMLKNSLNVGTDDLKQTLMNVLSIDRQCNAVTLNADSRVIDAWNHIVEELHKLYSTAITTCVNETAAMQYLATQIRRNSSEQPLDPTLEQDASRVLSQHREVIQRSVHEISRASDAEEALVEVASLPGCAESAILTTHTNNLKNIVRRERFIAAARKRFSDIVDDKLVKHMTAMKRGAFRPLLEVLGDVGEYKTISQGTIDNSMGDVTRMRADRVSLMGKISDARILTDAETRMWIDKFLALLELRKTQMEAEHSRIMCDKIVPSVRRILELVEIIDEPDGEKYRLAHQLDKPRMDEEGLDVSVPRPPSPSSELPPIPCVTDEMHVGFATL